VCTASSRAMWRIRRFSRRSQRDAALASDQDARQAWKCAAGRFFVYSLGFRPPVYRHCTDTGRRHATVEEVFLARLRPLPFRACFSRSCIPYRRNGPADQVLSRRPPSRGASSHVKHDYEGVYKKSRLPFRSRLSNDDYRRGVGHNRSDRVTDSGRCRRRRSHHSRL